MGDKDNVAGSPLAPDTTLEITLLINETTGENKDLSQYSLVEMEPSLTPPLLEFAPPAATEPEDDELLCPFEPFTRRVAERVVIPLELLQVIRAVTGPVTLAMVTLDTPVASRVSTAPFASRHEDAFDVVTYSFVESPTATSDGT